MKCTVCKCELPASMPCGIAPRVYIDEDGFIVGRVKGCPREPEKAPNYLPDDILPKIREYLDPIVKAAKDVAYEDYQNLWSARNGENYHLNFDAKELLAWWIQTFGDRLPKPYQRSDFGSERSYLAAIRFDVLRRSIPLVQNYALSELPPAKHRRGGHLGLERYETVLDRDGVEVQGHLGHADDC